MLASKPCPGRGFLLFFFFFFLPFSILLFSFRARSLVMVVIMMHSISFSFSLFSVFFRKDLYRFLLIYERDLRLNSACRRKSSSGELMD